MEVHHHPGTHQQGKKFKGYFLEFLMMFLAVTLGFFAESLRESIGDNNKEKEYIISMVQNLRDDTFHINATIAENEEKMQKLKKLMYLSRENINEPRGRKLFCTYSANAMGRYSAFKSNNATMLQLTNSGGLRFIKKSHAADSIAKYDIEMKVIYAAEEIYNNANNLGILATHQVLDYTVFYDSSYFKNGVFTDKLIPLITDDPQKIKLFYNGVDYEIGATGNYLYNLRQRVPLMKNLIAFLKKEYEIN